jgi:hypothetical protein
MKMTTDSINEEILRIKRELAGRFSNDLDRIVADTKSRERNAISLPPRPFAPEQREAPQVPINEVFKETSTPAAR